MKFRVLFSFLMLLAGTSVFAQFNWPEDPEKKKDAQTTYTLYDDSYKQGNYEAAKPHLEKILENYPNLSKAIYINGIKIYKDIWKKEKDAANKAAAAEKVMALYDKRFATFDGEEFKGIDRKAIDAFLFFYRDKAKTQFLLDMFSKTYELKGDKAFYPVGRYYMNTAALAFTRKIGISNDEILDIYNRTTQHIDAQIATAKGKNQNTKKYDDIKQAIDKKLADLKLIDCDFIVSKLVPEFEQNPDDAELANKIFVFAFDGQCTEADWFVKAAEKVFESDPNFGVAKLLASRYAKEKNYEKAKEYFMKASELTEDNTDKGSVLKQMASMMRIEGNKKEARNYAMQTMEVDPGLQSEMYEMIGDMILSSSECDAQQSQVDDRARFIAAYEYYQKAGNSLKMSQAKAQFPTIGDIFTANKEEGQSIFVGCWIQKSVKLTRRPEQ